MSGRLEPRSKDTWNSDISNGQIRKEPEAQLTEAWVGTSHGSLAMCCPQHRGRGECPELCGVETWRTLEDGGKEVSEPASLR